MLIITTTLCLLALASARPQDEECHGSSCLPQTPCYGDHCPVSQGSMPMPKLKDSDSTTTESPKPMSEKPEEEPENMISNEDKDEVDDMPSDVMDDMDDMIEDEEGENIFDILNDLPPELEIIPDEDNDSDDTNDGEVLDLARSFNFMDRRNSRNRYNSRRGSRWMNLRNHRRNLAGYFSNYGNRNRASRVCRKVRNGGRNLRVCQVINREYEYIPQFEDNDFVQVYDLGPAYSRMYRRNDWDFNYLGRPNYNRGTYNYYRRYGNRRGDGYRRRHSNRGSSSGRRSSKRGGRYGRRHRRSADSSLSYRRYGKRFGRNIGFSVNRSQRLSSPGRLAFRNVLANKGGAWDAIHNHFVAPTDGSYFFNYHAKAARARPFNIGLMRNGVRQVSAYGVNNREGSSSALLHLTRGDKVYLQLQDGSITELPGVKGVTTFNGFLLRTD